MATAFTPLKALQHHYDSDGLVPVTIHLLDGTVTELLDSYATVDDLPGLLPSDATYDASTGIPAGDWPLNYDSDAGVLELSTPDPTWVSDDHYSLSFRWIVLALTDGSIITTVDVGQITTLDDDPLQLHAAESQDLPNSYPVLRWRRT